MAMTRSILVTFCSIGLALGIGYSGLAKLLDMEGWSRRFEIFGVSSDLLIPTAVAELLGAILLFTPRFASYGAGIVLIVMSVAVWSHFESGVGDPTTAAVYALLALAVGALRLRQAWRPSSSR